MERIQSAIAKARSAREEQTTAPQPSNPIPAPAGPAGDVDAAWEALPAATPRRKVLKANRIVAGEGGPEAVHFDVMRARIMREVREHGRKRLVITSPSAGCGKSTMSLNLALSLSRQSEIRVVIVEVDLRRPSFARLLGLRQRHSLADVLKGEGRIEDNAVRIGQNLAVFSTAQAVRNPSDLFQSAVVPKILDRIEETYAPTLMLFDAPPILVSDDTLAFLQHADSALLVAAAGTTTIKEIDVCERELAEQTNVMGVALNKCRYLGPDYGSEYF